MGTPGGSVQCSKHNSHLQTSPGYSKETFVSLFYSLIKFCDMLSPAGDGYLIVCLYHSLTSSREEQQIPRDYFLITRATCCGEGQTRSVPSFQISIIRKGLEVIRLTGTHCCIFSTTGVLTS